MSETKNPFMKPVDESIFLFIPSISDKQAEYAARAINQHEKLLELAQLAYEVIEDDLDELPARHSLGNLSARLRTILQEETK